MLRKHPRSAALIAGLVSATGFAPLDLWPLTLLCLAVLTWLIETAPDRRSAFLRGWLFGVGHFTVGLNWIAHAFSFQDNMPHWFGYGAVFLLSLYLAVYPAIAALLAWIGTGRLGKSLLPLLFAAAWIVTEYLRATLFTGFAWNPLGVVWLPSGVAFAGKWIGTYALSGLAILAGGALVALFRRHFRFPALLGFGLLLLCGLSMLDDLGSVPSPGEESRGPAIRIVQPNIGQDVKYSPQSEAANYRKLAALSGQPTREPRLIFWPEAAIPAYLDMEPEWRWRLAELLGPNDLLLTGGDKVYFKSLERGLYQSRQLIGANNSLWILDARARLLGRYDKAHLVPYGEYLPMRPLLSAIGLSRLVPGDADFWPGPGPRSLTLPAAAGRPALKIGVQICYEIIFSGQVVDAANRPDFLFNPSNDAWFGSWGPPQHLAQARLRAIEEGVPILRSTPTGISAVVDADGRVTHSLPLQREGFIAAHLPRPHAPTFFARTGNWTPLLLALLMTLLAIATARRRR